MQIIQSRRDFLASAVRGRRRGRPWHAGIARRRGAAGDDHDPARRSSLASALRPTTWPRSCCTRKASPMSATYRCHCRPMSRHSRAARSISTYTSRRNSSSPWTSGADHDHRRCACRMLRAVRKGRHPQHRDLKGKSVGVPGPRARAPTCSWPAWLAMSGSTLPKDINWVTSATVKPIELFKDGKIDAFLGFPPEPQELHALKLGHVIVDSSVDRPWSQYFCCVLAGNARFRAQ